MALQQEFETQGNILFRYRSHIPLILIPFALIVIYYALQTQPDWFSNEDLTILEVAGIVICMLGLFIRIYTVGHTPKNTSGRNTAEGQVADVQNADHFINQVASNCNNFILHRQNSPADAEKLAEMMGTRNTLEYTEQVSQTGPTHMGTVRRTRGFIAHPDEIKSLQTGEAFFFSKENNKISKIRARRSRI